MTHPIKTVEVICYEPLAVLKDYEQGWSDVYLSYDAKPGRKRYHYGPTLMSRADLEGDLEFARTFYEQYPEWSDDGELLRISLLLGMLHTDVNGNGLVIDELDSPTPDIYTSRSSINHDEAERMIMFFMEMKGFPRVRLRWRRPKRSLFVIPVSFASVP